MTGFASEARRSETARPDVHERAVVVHRDVDVVLDVGSGGEGAARSVQDPDDGVVARLEPIEGASELARRPCG